MKLFVGDFHRQMLKVTEILPFDWLRANLSVKITDNMLHETLLGIPPDNSLSRYSSSIDYFCIVPLMITNPGGSIYSNENKLIKSGFISISLDHSLICNVIAHLCTQAGHPIIKAISNVMNLDTLRAL